MLRVTRAWGGRRSWWPGPLAATVSLGLAVVSGPSVQAVELTVMGRNPFMGEAVKLFNEQMKKAGRDVTATFVQGGHDKLQVTVAAGTPPDVMSLDLIEAPRFNKLGVFEPLESWYRQLPWRNNLSPGMLRLGLWQGQVYLLPFFSDNSALFYNLRRLAEAGLPATAPRTWDEFVVAAKKTTNPERDWYGVEQLPKWGGGGYMFLFMPWVWSNGGDLLSEDGSRAAIHSPEALQALELWRDLVLVHQVTRRQGSQFDTGRDAFLLSGNWNVAHLVQNVPELEWSVSLFPTRLPQQAPSSFVGGDLIGITRQSRYKQEAWELVQFLLSRDVQVDLFARNGIIPVRREFGNNPYFQREPRYYFFAEAAQVGRAPYSVVYNNLYDPLVRNLDPVFRGEASPRQALENLAREIDIVLREGLSR